MSNRDQMCSSGRRALRGTFRFMHGNILVLTVTQVLGMFCRSMVFPYRSLYILALGGQAAQIGFIYSVMPLAGLLMFPLGGYMADRMGRVKLIAFGGYLSGTIILMYILAQNWQVIALAAFLQGFMVFQFPANSALIADSLSPENRGMGIATMNTVASAVSIFAPYVAGVVVGIYGVEAGMRLLYAVMMAAYLISATINLRFLKETTQHHSGQALSLLSLPRVLRDAYTGIPATLRRLPRSLRALAAVLVLLFMANAVASPFWVVYAVQRIGLTSVEWGLILFIETALRSALSIPVGALVDRYGRTKFILASLLLSLVSIPLFALCDNFTEVLLIRLTAALINALFVPACSALMADTVPRDIRGRVMAALGQGAVMIGAAAGGTGGPGVGFLITIPLMVASFAGGYLYAYNPAYPWGFVGIASLLSLILAVLFIRDPGKAEI